MVSPADVARIQALLKNTHFSSGGGGGSAPSSAALEAAIKAAKKGAAAQQSAQDFDKFLRPAGRVLNALGSLGYGIEGAVDKRARRDKKALQAGKVIPGNPFQTLGDFAGSVGDAWTGNDKNLRTGSNIIEDVTDEFGTLNPGYKDTKDNVNPWVKGVGGFAADVVSDPLTYLGGLGIGKSILKGGLSAAVDAAKAAPEGLKTVAAVKAALNPLKGGKAALKEFEQHSIKKVATDEGKALVKQNIQDIKSGKVAPAHIPGLAEALPHLPNRTVKKLAGAAPEAVLDAVNKTGMQRVKDLIESSRAVTEKAPAPVVIAEKAATIPENAGGKVTEIAQAGQRVDADAAELSIRQNQAATMGSAMEQAAATMPATKTGALEALRSIQYSVPLQGRSNFARDSLIRQGTYPRAAAGATLEERKALNDLQSKWSTNVNQVLGKSNHAVLQKITDPDVYAEAVKGLFSERTIKAYSASATLSDLQRGLGTKRRIHDPASLEKFARLLGYTKTNWRDKSLGDFLRGRWTDVTDRFDKLALQDKQRQTFFEAQQIPGGDAMEALAKTMDPAEMRGAAGADFAHTYNSIPDLEQAGFHQAWNDSLPDSYRTDYSGKVYRWVDGAGDRMISNKPKPPNGVLVKGQWGIKEFVWNSQKTYSVLRKLLESSRDFTSGLKGRVAENAMYDKVMNYSSMLDNYLRSLGVAPVVGKLSAEGRAFGGKPGEYAFLGFSDVLKALPPDAVKALLVSGKDLSLAPTVIHDTARLALRAAGTPMSPAEQLAAVTKGVNAIVKSLAPSASKEFMLSPTGSKYLLALIHTMLTPDVMKSLGEANLRNGAVARASLGAQAQEMSKEAHQALVGALTATDGTTGSDVDAINKATKYLNNHISRTGMNATDAATLARADLETQLAKLSDIGRAKNVRAALRMDVASEAPKTEEALQAGIDANNAKVLLGKPTKPGRIVETVAGAASKKAATGGVATALMEEPKVLAPEVEELMQAVARGTDQEPADLDAIRAGLTMGLPWWLKTSWRVGQALSGGFGMRDLKVNEISAAVSTRKMANNFDRAVDSLMKTYDKPTRLAAWNVLRTLGKDNVLGPQHLAGVTDEVAKAVGETWPLMKTIFDHSDHSLFARAGLDPDYINGFLRKVRVPDAYWLTGNSRSWKVGSQWKKWDFGEDDDPFLIMAQYNRALQQASVVPGIAGSFASDFGHKSNLFGKAMTDTEAKAAGWRKIKPGSSGLSEWIDPEQYYDPKMIEQLSLMDEYLGKSKVLDQNSAFDKIFHVIDPIINIMKSSITLWRPGHHVTNMMGEGLFNTLAGVYNPARYGDALHVLASHGLIEGDTGDKVFQYLQRDAPQGFDLKVADGGKGVYATIGGKTTILSYDTVYKLLDKYGLILHHNQAEDLLTESGEALGSRTGVLARATQVANPNWLGNISANRDNVFRIAHAVDLMTKNNYRSIDEGMARIAREVHSYHPSMQTLSAFEQKYVRRFLYFYTWQRQALSRALESMVDTPGRVMIAPKFIYNASQAGGANPESFGHPIPNDSRVPDYNQGLINDVLWTGPEALGQEANTDQSFLWAADINAPQLDVFQSVFGNLEINPDKDPLTNATDVAGDFLLTTVGGQVTPALKIPFELATGSRIGSGGIPIKSVPDYLLDQTGASYAEKILAPQLRADYKGTSDPVEAQAARQRAIANWISGLKITDLTTPASAAAAQQQRNKEAARMAK